MRRTRVKMRRELSGEPTVIEAVTAKRTTSNGVVRRRLLAVETRQSHPEAGATRCAAAAHLRYVVVCRKESDQCATIEKMVSAGASSRNVCISRATLGPRGSAEDCWRGSRVAMTSSLFEFDAQFWNLHTLSQDLLLGSRYRHRCAATVGACQKAGVPPTTSFISCPRVIVIRKWSEDEESAGIQKVPPRQGRRQIPRSFFQNGSGNKTCCSSSTPETVVVSQAVRKSKPSKNTAVWKGWR